MNYWSSNSPLGGIPYVKNAQTKRESSYDKSGGNRDFWVVPKGETAVMMDVKGCGCIKHIWITTRCYDEMYLRKLVLEMYWDGEKNPSVRVPLGDFFGVGHATCRHYVSLPLNMIFGSKRGPKGPFAAAMNSYFPMPFSSGAKVQIINESNEPIQNLFFMIDYELTEDPMPVDMGRFHAMWRCEKPCKRIEYPKTEENPAPWDLPGKNTTGDENYVILDAQGKGQYVGCLLNIDDTDVAHQDYTWPGEGDDMIFVDGESWPPAIHGTGTEDYFGCAWGFPSGEYDGPYHGISLGSDPQEHFGKWSLYRWHIEDPVRFTKSIRVTIEHGHANDQGNDYSSVAYWYQIEPHKELPKLPEVSIRLPKRWPEHGLWDR
ncbi:MAG: DUF2961 domain-containing protein [Oscillospiraceae bacterium]|nr:DUF2961 domain-containing protein [Oscillospiraceae bacterium]